MIHTQPSVLTRLVQTVIHNVTRVSHVWRDARTHKGVDTVDACRVVVTRTAAAVVDVGLAEHTGEACRAVACKRVHAIQALASILTGDRRTLVDIALAVCAVISERAVTLVCCLVVVTSAAIHAWGGRTIVNIKLAIRAFIPGRTNAAVLVDSIHARS